jgi:uncharacterized protein YgiM (DUF1202 family)
MEMLRSKRCQSALKKRLAPLVKAEWKGLTGILIVSLLSMQAALAAPQSGTAIKASEIRTQPYSDAKVLATLASGDNVTILKKQGGWLRVKSAKGSGWVRMLSISKGAASRSGKADGLLGLASGRAGTGKVVATTGIRGLSEEDLKAAQFNAQELQLAESFATTPTEAQKFARQGQLTVQRFDYLPAPTAPTGGQRP